MELFKEIASSNNFAMIILSSSCYTSIPNINNTLFNEIEVIAVFLIRLKYIEITLLDVDDALKKFKSSGSNNIS